MSKNNYHQSHVLGHLILGVILHSSEKFLDQRMARVDLKSLLLVEVVVTLHVLTLGVSLRRDDSLHVGRPTKPGGDKSTW